MNQETNEVINEEEVDKIAKEVFIRGGLIGLSIGYLFGVASMIIGILLIIGVNEWL